MNYIIFNETTGARIQESSQLVSDPNFGTIIIDLPTGDYRLSVVGQKEFHGSIASINGTDYNSSHLLSPPGRGAGDIFFMNKTFTISYSDTSIEVELERIVSELEVKITDTFPNIAGTMWIQIDNEQRRYYFDGSNSTPDYTQLLERYPIGADHGSKGFSESRYHMNVSTEMDVKVTYIQNGTFDTIASKTVKVQLEKNKKTILTSSNFFQDVAPVPGDGSVVLDPAWGEAIEIPF